MIKKYYTDMQTNKTEQIDEYKKDAGLMWFLQKKKK